jgi:hypothetical protein
MSSAHQIDRHEVEGRRPASPKLEGHYCRSDFLKNVRLREDDEIRAGELLPHTVWFPGTILRNHSLACGTSRWVSGRQHAGRVCARVHEGADQALQLDALRTRSFTMLGAL